MSFPARGPVGVWGGVAVSVSDKRFAGALGASRLRDVCFPRDHGLPHAGHVRPAHVRRTVHLAVRHHSLPRVRPVALRHHLLDVRLLVVFIEFLAQVDLLLLLLGPLDQLLSAAGLARPALLVLSLLLPKELVLPLLVLRENLLDSRSFLVIQVVLCLLGLAAGTATEGAPGGLGWLETAHAVLAAEAHAHGGPASEGGLRGSLA